MRRNMVNNTPGLLEDAMGAYGYVDSQTLKERIVFIQQWMQEKDIAKHYPGEHFETLGMDLTPQFKIELAKKAEKVTQKLLNAGDLEWLSAKYIVNQNLDTQSLSETTKRVVKGAAIFC